MKLSIITINYNNAEGLRRTLDSVAEQSILASDTAASLKLEHIIVDGGSTDGSVAIIQDYEKHMSSFSSSFSLIWVSEHDKGIYNAMNKGIRMASGDYIQILNSGDCLASATVTEEGMRRLAEAGSNVMVLLGNIVQSWPDGRTVREKKYAAQDRSIHVLHPTLRSFYRGTIPHDAAYIRKEVYVRYGYYDEQMKVCSDWKLFLHAMVLGGNGQPPLEDGQVAYTNLDMVLFDMTGVSESNHAFWQTERRPELEASVPKGILRDYDAHATDMDQMDRLRRHHLYGLVWLLERILFKLEKWHILKS